MPATAGYTPIREALLRLHRTTRKNKPDARPQPPVTPEVMLAEMLAVLAGWKTQQWVMNGTALWTAVVGRVVHLKPFPALATTIDPVSHKLVITNNSGRKRVTLRQRRHIADRMDKGFREFVVSFALLMEERAKAPPTPEEQAEFDRQVADAQARRAALPPPEPVKELTQFEKNKLYLARVMVEIKAKGQAAREAHRPAVRAYPQTGRYQAAVQLPQFN